MGLSKAIPEIPGALSLHTIKGLAAMVGIEPIVSGISEGTTRRVRGPGPW